MASQGKIWINTRSQPYKHGSGSFKDAFQAEAAKGPLGFDFTQVMAQLPLIRDQTQIAPNCVIINFRVELEPGQQQNPEYQNQTDKFMKNTAVELELQSRFAVDGYALPILGLISTSSGETSSGETKQVVVMEQYGIANILAKIRSVPYYPLGSIDGFYVIMLKCGYNERSGKVLKLFADPPRDKQVIIDGVIDFINYAIDVQKILLVDFKPANLCRSPFEPGKVVGLDFDPKFCKNVSQYVVNPRAAAAMKAYMFLLFACIQYQFFPKDPNITIALHNGLEKLKVATLLDIITGNITFVDMFIHYLNLRHIPPLPPITPIEVRDILRDRYIDTIAAEAGLMRLAFAAAKAPEWEESMLEERGGNKKKRNKTKRSKTKRRKSKRF
jgi:hypothetical protein